MDASVSQFPDDDDRDDSRKLGSFAIKPADSAASPRIYCVVLSFVYRMSSVTD